MISSEDNKIMKPIEKPKRKQVKNACVNCQKACKKCDDGRPCKRCTKLGLIATCRNSDRKERKKGVKRGPYKKRQIHNKDKPVFPKALTEQDWKAPLYEHNAPQVPSHTIKLEPQTQLLDNYYIPSQQQQQQQQRYQQQHNFPLLSFSPTSLNSFVDESDETLHYAYGYYTNNTTITTTSSPSATSMLDHQAISGNGTPTRDEFHVWDDIENYSVAASSMGYNNQLAPNQTSILSDPSTQLQAYPTSDFEYYLSQSKDQIPASSSFSTFDVDVASIWFNDDMSLDFTSSIQYYNIPTYQLQQQHHHQDSINQMYF
ncbi:hypothetical protein [Parasitella parasitica]|uniref:Zn(2)-C6 fungal-type domain-containing protein n=1 Tax=Parasitella parasitica TaxID=35722 RepID=A0A0B7N8Y9_9FUNG|nr:hypothetical protein [Parasitella parasitica]